MRWRMWRISRGSPEAPAAGGPSEVHALYDKFKSYRSEVIDGATYVERMLEAVLCDALVGKDQVLRTRLTATVFSGESFTFFQKWKALRSLLHEPPNWLGTAVPNASERLKALHGAIGDRNKFAHGELSVDDQALQVSLRYFENSWQTVVVTDEWVKEVIGRMEESYFWLEGLHLDFYGYRAGT